MATLLFKSKKIRKLKETKEELEETKGEQFKKKIFNFYNLIKFIFGRYPVSGKIIGRISGRISIRCNPRNILFILLRRDVLFQHPYPVYSNILTIQGSNNLLRII